MAHVGLFIPGDAARSLLLFMQDIAVCMKEPEDDYLIETAHLQVATIASRYALHKNEDLITSRAWTITALEYTARHPQHDMRYVCATNGCESMEIGSLQCSRCKSRSYCNRTCQKK